MFFSLKMECSLPLISNGHAAAHLSCYSLNSRSPTISRWGMQYNQEATLTHLVNRRNNHTAFRVLVNSDVSSGRGNAKGNAKSDVIMVDPLEAKRLAAKQMEEIKAQEKFERQRRIEAINGAWAMIGLTAGLVIEGRTGDSIPTQLAGYWSVVIGFFTQILPIDLLNQWNVSETALSIQKYVSELKL